MAYIYKFSLKTLAIKIVNNIFLSFNLEALLFKGPLSNYNYFREKKILTNLFMGNMYLYKRKY